MIIFLNRIPIPNLRHYCLVSLSLFAIVFLYAQKVLHDLTNAKFANEKYDAAYVEENGYFYTTFKMITSEPWCIWVLVNFCYCGLLIFSKIIQNIIFGKLRAIENQHIKDHFWNFIFLKFIFIFGVLNLEAVNEIVMWTTWFSIIGFLCIHVQICKDRFEYLLFSPNTPLQSHLKVLSFLVVIQGCSLGLVAAGVYVQKEFGFSISLFMLAESLGLSLRTLYVILKYSVHLWDIYSTNQLNNKGTINYYLDLSFEVTVITIDFLHYFHMLIYGNFYLSMASLVICMELKRLFFDLRRRVKRHTNYLRVIEKMEKRFPWASQEELTNSEKCAVCWEILDKGRRLPCSHVFHQHCLRSWLEQHTSCPTCRKSLNDEKEPTTPTAPNTATGTQQQPTTATAAAPGAANTAPNAGAPDNAQQQRLPAAAFNGLNVQRNYFHFNGSRYFSWLPNFSIQVTNGGNLLPNLLGAPRGILDTERLNQMTEQVRQMFPNIPVELIQRDLNLTHSVEITIENILDDRVLAANGPNGGNATANAANRGGGNNFFNDDSDDGGPDDDDEDENTTTDDDFNQTDHHHTLRQRSNLLNDLLEGLNVNNMTENAATATNQQTGGGSNETAQASQSTSDEQASSAAVLAKYTPSPALSKNANDLMARKRELILNSKKRYLEKVNAAKSPAATESSKADTSPSFVVSPDARDEPGSSNLVVDTEEAVTLRLRTPHQPTTLGEQ